MPDPKTRAARYRARAEKCITIADTCGDATLRGHHMQVADTYMRLAQMETAGIGGAHDEAMRLPW